jgi:hypothetical protein
MTLRSVFAGILLAAAFHLAFGQQESPLPNPISSPGAPWAFVGYVVDSPKAQGWFTQFKTPLAVSAGTKLEGNNHTFVVKTATLKIDAKFDNADQFAEYMRANRGKQTDMQRFELVEHREAAVTHLGQPCSRYLIKAKDKGVVFWGSVPLLMAGITCSHPQEQNVLVDVGYSERGGEEKFSESSKDVGERVISSLRFVQTGSRAEYEEARKLEAAGELDKAVKLLVPLAEAGDRRASLLAGMHLLDQRTVDKNFDAARRYLLEAAKDGYVDAYFNLGAIYDKALGVPRDPAEAAKWFKLAADQRDNQAQLNLAILYGRGDGVPRDLEAADRWGRMAANNGNERARQILRGR